MLLHLQKSRGYILKPIGFFIGVRGNFYLSVPSGCFDALLVQRMKEALKGWEKLFEKCLYHLEYMKF